MEFGCLSGLPDLLIRVLFAGGMGGREGTRYGSPVIPPPDMCPGHRRVPVSRCSRPARIHLGKQGSTRRAGPGECPGVCTRACGGV